MEVIIEFQGKIPYNTKNFKYNKTWWLNKAIEKTGILQCSNCDKILDEKSIATITKKTKTVKFRSGSGKIACSKSCATTLSLVELHKQFPERYKNCFIERNKKLKELGFDEYYGDKAADIKNRMSINSSTDNGKWHSSHTEDKRNEMKASQSFYNSLHQKGKSWEARLGQERAAINKSAAVTRMSGENNPNYGKCPSVWSGGGINGRYKHFFFRSLIELSYLYDNEDILYIENAENSKFKVEYLLEGNQYNYFPDFYNKKTDSVIEIKHSKSVKKMDDRLKAKIEAASNKFCNFYLLTEKEIQIIKYDKLKILVENKEVFLNTKSYKKLFGIVDAEEAQDSIN